MMFFQYLQLKQVWEGTETCCSLCPQYLIKHFGTTVNQYEPVLKKLSVQVHGSDVIHFKGWFRFKSDKIMQFGSVFDLWFTSKSYMKYGNTTNYQCGEVSDKHSYVNTFSARCLNASSIWQSRVRLTDKNMTEKQVGLFNVLYLCM
jgi:hypothetical protein